MRRRVVGFELTKLGKLLVELEDVFAANFLFYFDGGGAVCVGEEDVEFSLIGEGDALIDGVKLDGA